MAAELHYALAIIGAGLYGIQAARTYLEIHPDHEVIVFEASGCVGGVWSQERMYDDFWTQTTLGIAEFSDMPLEDVPVADTYYGFFRARHIARYLQSYVEKHTFADTTLESRIRLNAKVQKLVKSTSSWILEVEYTVGSSSERVLYHAAKVMDATGLTSMPNMPLLPGRETFTGDILHHRDFGKIQDQLKTTDRWQQVTVLGGAKSAADMVYAFAKSGRKVSWIIRKSGAGPAAFVSVKGSGMYANSNESFYTRLTSHFLASIFVEESKSVLGRFLYDSRIGRWLLSIIWHRIDAKAHATADYSRADGKANHFYNLKPDTSIFWQNDSTGICQRPDFFDTIAHNVQVFRDDIKCLTSKEITLAGGQIITSDLLVCGTGWKTSHPSIVDSNGHLLESGLGLAGDPTTIAETHPHCDWRQLEEKAADHVFERFVMLKNPPIKPIDPEHNPRPLRLYKGILPLHDHSITFLGQMLLGNNFRVAEVQALFAVAAMDGKLELPSQDEMRKDIAQMIAWNRCRYLRKGQQGTWFYWDMVPYTDHLLEFMGLQSHRHKGYFKDLLFTCYAKDLVDLITEYIRKTYEATSAKELLSNNET